MPENDANISPLHVNEIHHSYLSALQAEALSITGIYSLLETLIDYRDTLLYKEACHDRRNHRCTRHNASYRNS